jgi:hypothetical protein
MSPITAVHGISIRAEKEGITRMLISQTLAPVTGNMRTPFAYDPHRKGSPDIGLSTDTHTRLGWELKTL